MYVLPDTRDEWAWNRSITLTHITPMVSPRLLLLLLPPPPPLIKQQQREIFAAMHEDLHKPMHEADVTEVSTRTSI